MRLTAGTRVGPYEVMALLGAGGMAEVYRARDTRLGRDVALKVVSEALGSDSELLARLEREAKLAGSLNHPNVVAVYDVGTHEGSPYFVTELLNGETLRERLTKGTVPLPTALDWAAQMAQGLAAAHERGVIHRDLKPENAFITHDGHVKLLDFGIAKLAEASRSAVAPTRDGLMDATASPSGASTGTGMVLGTPGYMSPEQVRGDLLDARTDFFSLGSIVYELLSGRRAFPAGPVVESGYAILHNEPEPLPATVPVQVAQVVHRCLEKDRARRFQSARDLAFNLELFRNPTASGLHGTMGPARPLGRSLRRRWLAALVGLAAVLVIGGASLVARATRPPNPGVEQVTVHLGMISAARFNRDRRIVFSAAWNGQPLELFSAAEMEPEPQSLGVRDANLLGISPDGELAVLLGRSGWGTGTLALVPRAGGPPREIAEGVIAADWSPTGELAIVRPFEEGAFQLEYPLGTPLFKSPSYLSYPRVGPKGDRVAFIGSDTESDGFAVMVAYPQGQVRKLADVKFMWGGLAWSPDGEEVWFAEGNEIWASPMSGGRRLVWRGLLPMRLEDISPDGRVLIESHDHRVEIACLSETDKREHLLTWLDDSQLAAISADGRRILFSAFPIGAAITYVRATDGAPPVKLGPGNPLDLSPDGKWVLATPSNVELSALSIFPVGAGAAKRLELPGFTIRRASWFHDGTRVAVAALSSDTKQTRLLSVPLDGGVPVPIMTEGVTRFVISPDDRFVAARSSKGVLTLYPMDGGTPLPLPELGRVSPARWSGGMQLWLRDPVSPTSTRLARYDIDSRRVLEERLVTTVDQVGLLSVYNVNVSEDGRVVAFNYERALGNLFVLKGLAPPRR